MGMPATIEIPGEGEAVRALIGRVFSLFDGIDARFSTYKRESEVSRVNRGEIKEREWSPEMREVMALARGAKAESRGYFDAHTPEGALDPSGAVKGWAIRKAAELVRRAGKTDFYIEIAGDMQVSGVDSEGHPWRIGIRNPFNRDEIVKVVVPGGRGVATSGTAARGQHIYNPHAPETPLTDIASITVVGPDVCAADLMATAAFAMGKGGATFIENLPGFEAYMIASGGTAIMTSGFEKLTTV